MNHHGGRRNPSIGARQQSQVPQNLNPQYDINAVNDKALDENIAMICLDKNFATIESTALYALKDILKDCKFQGL